jgi:hypothetical protein
MSQENVEIVRRWIGDYNRRHTEGLIGLTDPEFVFRSYFVTIESLIPGLRRLADLLHRTRRRLRALRGRPERHDRRGLRRSDGCSCQVARQGEGAEGETPIHTAFWLKTGKVFRMETYSDRAEALEAVGLSEQDAHADS